MIYLESDQYLFNILCLCAMRFRKFEKLSEFEVEKAEQYFLSNINVSFLL